jgi:hypothetical protein
LFQVDKELRRKRETVGDKVDDMKNSAHEKIGMAKQKVSDVAGGVKDKVSSRAES